ncbi:MAG: orotidine-5'-phosphate decarboxylase [archaeon]|nr:orotidine-5'-phosphate decarboxylase [archaeon]MCP8313539.1 orotidine-5'-phosphate decarboxylase [archaeon]MCP8321922.1 orotidine-5'-phosphate decarboxylase [archaeon]
MKKSFADRIIISSKEHFSRVVLALDIVANKRIQLIERALSLLNKLSPHIAALKLNYHLLLPLNLFTDVKRIVDNAHKYGLQVIADLKLNDIASTNLVACDYLWRAGFDAIIANPFIGYEEGLEPVIKRAHEINKGIILLAYMSHKGSKEGYGLTVIDKNLKQEKIYELFVKRAIDWNADGIVVGSTDLDILSSIASRAKGKLLTFSPGIGAQGGDAMKAVKAGADFIIVGRSIIESKDPLSKLVEINKATYP